MEKVSVRRLALTLLLGTSLQAESIEAKIASLSESLRDTVIASRRDFHMYPELSNREFRTGKTIAAKLRALGFDEVKEGVAKTGVIGILKGGKPGPVVAWRADIDALPVISELTVPYKSKNPGVHHACGHDGHIAIGLGVAEVLSKLRAEIPGTVKFLFQPAEESPPVGEEGGASLMVREGALQNPRPGAIFGLHISTWLPAGVFGIVSGPAMASGDFFDITIKGKQVHGAMPHAGIDTVVVASECVVALQAIRSRRIDPMEPMVLSIGSIHGGNRHNIITGEVKMEGTMRTFNESVRESARTMMRQTLAGCTSTYGATYMLSFREPSYPVLMNPPVLVEESLPLMRRVGGDHVQTVKPTTGAEDFPYYQREIPGFFWFLGSKNEKLGITAAHHTPDFNIDEDILVPGVRMAASQLVDWLKRHSH
ncbi:MAG: amidohydrolase [Bryobacterales bacterium]|nr:amidohydrolase [Bryobacterales bacterium]